MNRAQQKPEVYEFLKKHHLGVLSTVSEHGKPWGAAIYFVVDEEFNLYFVTRAGTGKYKNIMHNATVALTVFDEESQTTVQLAGETSPVAPENYMDVIFTKLAHALPSDDINWAPPLEKVHKGDYMPLCIKPISMQFANYKPPVKDFDQEYIQKII